MPTLGELYPVNAAEFAKEADIYAERFRYLVTKRDQMQDKLRFGIFTLNGASLVALMAMLNGEGEAAKWIGLNPVTARYATVAFATGAVMAGISAIAQSNLFTHEAGDANTRRLKVQWISSYHSALATDETKIKLEQFVDDLENAPLIDFQYSPTAIWLQNFAGGAWLSGILFPLCATFF